MTEFGQGKPAALPEGDVADALDKLLEGIYWPSTLNPGGTYFRTHDDCDGDLCQVIEVFLAKDGDVHLSPSAVPLRFRTEFGGGQSPRVRNGLLILAEAIRRDNMVPQICIRHLCD